MPNGIIFIIISSADYFFPISHLAYKMSKYNVKWPSSSPRVYADIFQRFLQETV